MHCHPEAAPAKGHSNSGCLSSAMPESQMLCPALVIAESWPPPSSNRAHEWNTSAQHVLLSTRPRAGFTRSMGQLVLGKLSRSRDKVKLP